MGVGFPDDHGWGVANVRLCPPMFRLFPPVDCRRILDVGASNGSFTDRAMRCFEVERVWLVEANPDAAAALQRKYAHEPRCKVIPQASAIAANRGDVRFHIAAHAGSSAVQFGVAPIRVEQTERLLTVPAVTLDELFQQEQIEHVDLMKWTPLKKLKNFSPPKNAETQCFRVCCGTLVLKCEN